MSKYSNLPVRVLEATPETVRRVVGMYFGSADSSGIYRLVLEVLANAIDQVAARKASTINVRREHDFFIITDDGEGFPLDRPHAVNSSLGEYFATTPHQTATADGHAPHLHPTGGSGAGLFAVAAVCTSLSIRVWKNGQEWFQEFRKGVPGPPKHSVSTGRQGSGSEFRFRPDPEVFPNSSLDWTRLRARCFELAHLLEGVRLEFGQEVFQPGNGLLDLAPIFWGPSIYGVTPVRLKERIDFVELDLVIAASSSFHGPHEKWVTFCNGSRTFEHGSHLDGVLSVLQDMGHGNSSGLLHTIHHEARYAGPTRTKLEVPAVEQLLVARLPSLLAPLLAAR